MKTCPAQRHDSKSSRAAAPCVQPLAAVTSVGSVHFGDWKITSEEGTAP